MQAITLKGKRTFKVSDLEDASEQWSDYRDLSGKGVSQIGNGVRVVDDSGVEVGRVSYNGRVWMAV